MLSALMEWLGIMFSGNTSIPSWLLLCIKCIDYTLTPIAGAALITNVQTGSICKKIISYILAVNVVFQVISLFTGWMIIIDEKNYYHHASLYPVYMALYSLLIIVIAIDFVIYGKNFRIQNRISLYSILALVLLCILIQEFSSNDLRTAYTGMTLGMIMMFIYITEFTQQTTNETIHKQQIAITTDTMTGIPNRYAFVEDMKELSKTSPLPENLTIYSIDINGLKTVNDTLGHAAGDELICAAAHTISSTFDALGKCYRTGGDEFVACANMDKKQIDEILIKLKENAAKWHGKLVDNLYFSVGYARSEDYPDLSVERLFIKADMAMYEEKDAFHRKTTYKF